MSETSPTTQDKKIMVAANKAAAHLAEEVDFENYVIGYFVLHSNRYIDSSFYDVDYSRKYPVRLTKAARVVQ